jgi:D-alanyl-D-alanine carboxypeptidase (penicillin-binding protein 5/6)
MKIVSLFVAVLTVVFPGSSWAAAKPIPDPPTLNASSYFLVDFDSGRVLAEKDPDKHIEPASITKLMTAYLVDKAIADGDITLDEKVTISEKAWRMKGSKMFVEVGKQVAVEDLLKGLIIQSGNDASVALAEHIAGSESAFAGYMNHQAQLLGMQNTTATTGSANTPSTRYANSTATACYGVTRPSTGSKPATPSPPAFAWWLRPSATTCA